MQKKNPIFEIKNLCVEFLKNKKNVLALENINLKIFLGECVALVGESGSGKTLCAKAVMNILPKNAKIASGEIFFLKKNILRLSESEQKKIFGKDISMIFQDASAALDPLCKCGKQIEEGAIVHGMEKKLARKKAKEMMKKTSLSQEQIKRIYNGYPHTLSGGQKQRVLICASLINSPSLLIADEPTSSLDAAIQKEVLEEILKLNSEAKTSLFLITHDFSVVKKTCQRVYVMKNGRIVESGRTKEVLQNPLHPYTKELLQAAKINFSKNQSGEIL